MSLFYLDEQIVFDEDNYLLYAHAAQDNEPLRVGAIASSCLAQLLRAQGGVVIKRDLIEGAWGQFGLEVTDNSLAQVVRQLRLALEKLQPEREYIVTLPRIGYKLADQVQLREIHISPSSTPPVAPSEAALERPQPGAEAESESASETESESEATPAAISSNEPGPLQPVAPPAMPSASKAPLCSNGWLHGGLLLLGCLLLFTLALFMRMRPLPIEPLAFAPAIERPQVLIHLLAKNPPASARQLDGWAEQARQLAAISQLQSTPVHLYLLERDELQGFICTAALGSTGNHCVGVSADAQLP